MKNRVELEGELVELKVFNETVGSAKIAIRNTYQGREHENHFFVTVFKDQLAKMQGVPLGSEIACDARLKNSQYEKNGQNVFKLEIVLTKFVVLKENTRGLEVAKLHSQPQDWQSVRNDKVYSEAEVERIGIRRPQEIPF